MLGNPGDTGIAVDEIAAIVRRTSTDEIARESLIQLISQLSGFFLLVVELDEAVVGRRTIVKYTYREDRDDGELRPLRPLFEFDLPDFGAAASTHFELAPPPLTVVVDAYIADAASTEGRGTVFAEVHRSVVTCHLVAKPGDRSAHAVARVRLVPRPYGAMTAMWVGALGIFATLAVIVVVRFARMQGLLPSAPAGSGAVAALLAGTGLLLTWIARAPEDWTTSQILLNARQSLMASAILAAMVTAFLSVPVGEPARSITW